MRITSLVLILVFCCSLSAPSIGGDGDFENPPGWTWSVKPMRISIGSGMSVNDILMVSSIDKNGAFTLTVGWRHEANTDYRAVVFDSSMQRHLSSWSVGPGSEDMTLTRYTWNEINPEKITHVGFEKLTSDGWLIVSENALSRARAKGIQVLSYPRIGKSYEFDLETLDGKTIRSKELLGKVVVIDCWATWCKPCMQKIPEIQTFQKTQDSEKFEVIGINYDQKVELLNKALSQNEILWPTVHVPPDPETRNLWFEASSIRMLPRLLVLDKNGTMRLDTNDVDVLKSTVLSLLSEAE